jgi:NAD(P)-dependent dehydrogenase (short-subunit alcohol dehydrogenase family)
MGVTLSQMFPRGAPTLTGDNLPSQKDKVFIVTGGYSGVGLELSRILYQAGGKVYIAGRSPSKASQGILEIKASPLHPNHEPGVVEFLKVDLGDLSGIKASVEEFNKKEKKLDVLWNNAAAQPPVGTVSPQGHELTVATNCLGHYLFTQLLLPSLQSAAKDSPPGSVRVVWTSSQVVDLSAPTSGFSISDLTNAANTQDTNYVLSKTGNWFLANELALQVKKDGILSLTQNPGALKTNLLRDRSPWLQWAVQPMLYSARFGAFTELWAGLSTEIGMRESGGYVIPWGRMHPGPRQDLLDALKSKEEGGTGRSKDFGEWCWERTREFR